MIGEMFGDMLPDADILLVTLLEVGEDVQMSKKNTSSLVEEVRLALSENRMTLLRGFESSVRCLELTHSRD